MELSLSRLASLSVIATGLVIHTMTGHAATIVLPAEIAVPLSSSTNRGFVVRSVQAPQTTTVANSVVRAIKQLNGTLTDASGNIVTNEAIPNPGTPDGSYTPDTINFESAGLPFDVVDPDGNILTSFTPNLFPGIPGIDGHTLNFAVEVVGFVQLSAGTHTLGVSVSADRTDVNDDDSYQVFVGANPRDFFNLKVAEYERLARAFVADQHIENQFTVQASVAGLYPFRIAYWQVGRGANLQWYTVNTNTGERILLNDPANAAALAVYRDSTIARANSPYFGEVSPNPGSAGNSPSAPIEIVLFDGKTTVSTNTVRLSLNGATVTPQTLTKTAARTTIRYSPNATRTDPNNAIQLIFADSAGVSYTNNWSFTINVAGGSATTVAGQWDFDQGDLRATLGQALQYFDGPTGMTATKTKFGTTGAGDFATIPHINGQPAKIMYVPSDVIRQIGYVMTHGIAPNGGGTRVNQYTLIMDVLVGSTGPGAASILQISSTNNMDDGDLFWQGNNFGQGTGGYNGTGAFTPGIWHRIVAAYDEAANPPVVTKYVDGIKQDDWTANQGLDNPRRALLPTAILFADGDVPNPDERREWWVNSIQIRAGKMSDAEIVALGGAGADGIPQVVLANNIAGQWDFNGGNLAATIGKPLQYFDGPNGLTAAGTKFGTTGEGDFAAIPHINGQPAKIMYVPGDVIREIGYIMDHGIRPNGGGTRVNQYTIIFDVMIGATGPGAASMLQISSTNNMDDGDLFWQGNQFGQGTGGYNGTGAFTPAAWHRVVAAYDEAASPPVVTKFVDGIKQDDWTANQGLDNPRRALLPTAILFADGDVPNPDERREWWVNSIQIRPGKMSDSEIALLGGPSADGIPIFVPPSNVAGQWDFDLGNLAATIGKALQYFDGPSGLTATGTRFGTTGEGDFASIPNINGQPAKIMFVPGDVIRQIGYIMDHGIKPNGGGTRVNQYTIIFDAMIGTTGPGAASILQISSTNNMDDGDLFWQGNNFGQGTGGYNGTSAFTPGQWHRVIAAYNEAATPPVVTKYVDGIFQDDWTANQGLDNPRRALLPTAILFADGDVPNPDERREWWVNSIQIRSGVLSKEEMAALGGPSASGIPVLIAATPPFRISQISVAAGTVSITWSGGKGPYQLQRKASLPDAAWQNVGAPTSSTSATDSLSGGSAFYRVQGQP